ncbi:hypothetical protein JVT61DRAFT_10367 [Boletus reticuloceps]|uniref:Uncharacterized protein n=1 Tax=Boletus reticuloceps TaxID=495285 RepID=A0A8I3AEW3_9AGAM|nr:hypothetical protein JVT61DRAFT_10367 [Boletus reticuloceps]
MNVSKGQLNLGIMTGKQTWQKCILKKAIQEAVALGYALHAPPSAISCDARMAFIKDRAMQLLQDTEYLLGDIDEQVSDLLYPIFD